MPALPPPVAAYVEAANRLDAEAMLAPFAADAVVRDEGRDHPGRDAVRAWIVETNCKYRVQVTPLTFAATDAGGVMTARVEGDFPGSPAILTYRFALADGRIAGLEIGA